MASTQDAPGIFGMNFEVESKLACEFSKVVLVFSHMFPNPSNPVAGTFVSEQLQALRRLGVKALVVSPVPWLPSLLGFLPRVRKFRGVPRQTEVAGCPVEYPRVVMFPSKKVYLEGLLYYLRCRTLIRRLVREHDVALIHVHMLSPDGLAAIQIGRELNLPVVCTVHGSDIRIYPHRDRITLRLTKWALKNADHVMAVSSSLMRDALSLSEARVSVVHNGADPDAFRSTSKAEARQKLGLSREKKILLFVGHLRPVKGIEFLLEAVGGLREDLELVLVGDGESLDALSSMADRLGIAKMCNFVGRRPHAEIPVWLAAADCLVLPSLSEGLPTIVVEAMFCRTPVVATNVGGIPEIVDDRRTGLLVSPKDPGQLAKAIAEVLTNQNLANALVDRAESAVRGNLTWEANARSTIAVYKQVLQGRIRSVRAASGSYASSSVE